METLKKILIVDDSETNNILIRSLLEENAEYSVKTLTSSRNVLALVKDYLPDLILLDLMMPFKDGYEVLKELKSDVDTVDIPVVVVSAKQDGEGSDSVKELGAIDFISKPIGNSGLIEKVKKYLHTSKV